MFCIQVVALFFPKVQYYYIIKLFFIFNLQISRICSAKPLINQAGMLVNTEPEMQMSLHEELLIQLHIHRT